MSHKFVYIHGYIYIWYSPSKLCPNLFEKNVKKIYTPKYAKNTVNTGKGTERVGTGGGHHIYIYIGVNYPKPSFQILQQLQIFYNLPFMYVFQ